MAYNVKKIDYADGSSEVRIYSNAMDLPREKKKKNTDICIERSEQEIIRSRQNSIKRSKDRVDFVGRTNKWRFFTTLTFDNRYFDGTYESASFLIQQWLDCMRHRYPGMKYLIVLEMGSKNNRWHAHALIADCDLRMHDSGRKTENHQPIYNLDLEEYSYGFTTVTYVRSSAAAGRYISKYIGKALGDVPEGKKRYWTSHNLVSDREVVTKYLFDHYDLEILKKQLEETCDRSSEIFVEVIDTIVTYFHFYASGGSPAGCPT